MRFFYYNLGSILVTMVEMKSNSNNINYYDKSSLTDDENTLLGKVVVSTKKYSNSIYPQQDIGIHSFAP